MIKDYLLTSTEIRYNMSMIVEAMLSFLTYEHSNQEDLCVNTTRQCTRFDHVTRFLGGPIVMWHKLRKDYKEKSLMVDQFEAICKAHHARLEAYMLLVSNNQKYSARL